MLECRVALAASDCLAMQEQPVHQEHLREHLFNPTHLFLFHITSTITQTIPIFTVMQPGHTPSSMFSSMFRSM